MEYFKEIKYLTINAPLRSLPNGVKDIAYIKNNKLYVDRHVGNVVLDGTQPILAYNFSTYGVQYRVDAITNNSKQNSSLFCSHYIPYIYSETKNINGITVYTENYNRFLINDERFGTSITNTDE